MYLYQWTILTGGSFLPELMLVGDCQGVGSRPGICLVVLLRQGSELDEARLELVILTDDLALGILYGVLSLDIRFESVHVETEHGCCGHEESVHAGFAQITLSLFVDVGLHGNCPVVGSVLQRVAASPLELTIVLLIDDALAVVLANLLVETSWKNCR